MSRHRRQASQVLPPEILTGNESLGDLGKATGGLPGQTHTSTGATAVVDNERSTNPTTTQRQDQSSASHFPTTAKKPPAGKPA